ncbi:MAG: site-specific integrase, partial [Blastocatellia bacterium]|nr:site-specific integrase [Blastocatellia bacterium]
MKAQEGYVVYNKKRKRWCARVTGTNPLTGERVDKRRFAETKTAALEKKRALLNQFKSQGVQSFSPDQVTFSQVARKYKQEKLIEPVYVGEKKIAGMRDLISPDGWIRQLLFYYGSKKLAAITKNEINKFKIWLAELPVKSVILDKSDPQFTTKFEKAKEQIKDHTIKESANGDIVLIRNNQGEQRSIQAINRPVELLRAIINYAIDEKLLPADDSPFKAKRNGLIERKAETKRERWPTFGEELALLSVCEGEREHLKPILILFSDTGLRENELFTLGLNDIRWETYQIRVKAKNAKTNIARFIPMTTRVIEQLRVLYETNRHHPSGLVFGGLKEIKRSFATACRMTGIEDLHKHDFRHAFITRSILAGIPVAVALKASGHASDEWKRYLNVTPDQLQSLFTPL